MNKQLISLGLAGIGGIALYKIYERGLNSSDESIKDALNEWLRRVCEEEAHDIVELYAPDGVLLGTIADKMKVGQHEVIEYFKMFKTKNPCGEYLSINIQNYGSIAICDGYYEFQLDNEDGERDNVLARFTFVLRKIGGKWRIASHHSSAQP